MPAEDEQGLRQQLAGASPLVVKVGSSSLTDARGRLDLAALTALVDALAAHRAEGHAVVLVSSGAIAAGMAPLDLPRRPTDLPTQQAAASVGQGVLLAAYTAAFAAHGLVVGQVLLTADDVTRRGHYLNARHTLERLLSMGVVPVVNENDTVATHEIRFGDNDRLAALVAQLIDAHGLLLLSDVDALYDGPPSRPGSARVSFVPTVDALQDVQIGGSASGVGTGGMVTKVEAAAIATSAGVPTLLTAAGHADVALSAGDVGTVFAPTRGRGRARRIWLEHATAPQGRLVLDDGAVAAVTQRRTSLLPAGIRAVEGTFSTGDAVDVVDPSGGVVARGLVNYGSHELPALLGRGTKELARELGPAYEREVIHRDDLVVLSRRRR
ncbi:glutamate 5-kinase [Allobranchiibius sp. CTAmp26]|uniref:glutamate 5-kinase n=1 Tax=Allobranchiibius sp. CTAmp26 TaxID=2815214 RepID=UPI001AA0D6AB|nr:glutamate 5-kinase [Allobranchiibius sp. CTAmp26]MBO1756037.1 glutamate 5-kinase [Allobranchiibius sp. CTAmp26]